MHVVKSGANQNTVTSDFWKWLVSQACKQQTMPTGKHAKMMIHNRMQMQHISAWQIKVSNFVL